MTGKARPVTAGLLVIVLLLAPMPVTAEETRETNTRDLEDLQEDARERIDEYWADQPVPDTEELADLIVDLHGEDGLEKDEKVALVKGLRAHEAGRTDGRADGAVEDALSTLIEERAQAQAGSEGGPGGSDDPWQDDTWDSYGTALTAAYLAGGEAHPVFLPETPQVEDLEIFTETSSGCTGDSFSGYCYFRFLADALAVVTWDMHKTTDTILAQLPVGIEVRAHWECTDTLWGECVAWTFWIEVVELDRAIAKDTSYTMAFPAASGQLATRATDHTLLQTIYDELGELDFQKARGVTSARATTTASNLAENPAPAEVPTLPGVSDLHAVSPRPNHYGVQSPPELGLAGAHGEVQTAIEDQRSQVPALLRGTFDHLPDTWHDVRVRERASHGTAPADSLGPTVEFNANKLVTWHLTLLIVRWKNAGPGSAGQAEAPASFYYDAGHHEIAGSGNLWTVDYPITQEVETPG